MLSSCSLLQEVSGSARRPKKGKKENKCEKKSANKCRKVEQSFCMQSWLGLWDPRHNLVNTKQLEKPREQRLYASTILERNKKSYWELLNIRIYSDSSLKTSKDGLCCVRIPSVWPLNSCQLHLKKSWNSYRKCIEALGFLSVDGLKHSRQVTSLTQTFQF